MPTLENYALLKPKHNTQQAIVEVVEHSITNSNKLLR